jgi:hypothetical protein
VSRLARAVVRGASSLIASHDIRARYREQWLADVDGAGELGIAPTRVALGAALAAVQLAVHPQSRAALAEVLRLPGTSPTARRILGVVQLGSVMPWLWAIAFYGYARVGAGVADAELFQGGRDPRSVADSALMYWAHGLTAVWLALHGWILMAALGPVGALLSIGGRRSARWLPLTGALAASAVTALALSDFGHALRGWFTD